MITDAFHCKGKMIQKQGKSEGFSQVFEQLTNPRGYYFACLIPGFRAAYIPLADLYTSLFGRGKYQGQG